MQVMILEKNKDGYLEPEEEHDAAAFEHCCGGSSSITYGAYQDAFREVFRLHNIDTRIKGDRP